MLRISEARMGFYGSWNKGDLYFGVNGWNNDMLNAGYFNSREEVEEALIKSTRNPVTFKDLSIGERFALGTFKYEKIQNIVVAGLTYNCVELDKRTLYICHGEVEVERL